MSDAEVNAYAEKIANCVPEYSQAMKDLDVERKRLESIQNFTNILKVHYWQKTFN
jgi:hypothetical protein